MYYWGNSRRFNAWSDMSRKLYGTRLQKLTINAGFTCPNRDGTVGTGGCSFCNNEGFNPSYCDPEKAIRQQIDQGLELIRKRYPRAGKFVAYFQAYSNTHAPLETLRDIYEEALSHPAISGLVIGTRPDCVDEEKLDYLRDLARHYFIKLEYGVESCYDETLKRINRGHTFRDTKIALQMTGERELHAGIHMLFGLPGERREAMLAQVDIINTLPINTIKFHQLQIVEGTPFARAFKENPGQFDLFELEDYIDFIVAFLERLRPDISVDRLSGEVPPRFIVGQRWSKRGNIRADVVMQMIEKKLAEKDTFQGKRYA
ncbi:MAG: TIGR01212 family radical SAM protein [Bacteroidales bacterium]